VSEEDEAVLLTGSGLVEFLRSFILLCFVDWDTEPLTPALSPSDGERETCPAGDREGVDVCGKVETLGFAESSLFVSGHALGP